MRQKGFKFRFSNKATRKGDKGKNDTNIDIIAYKGLDDQLIKVEFLEFNDCSDHVPIIVKI